ncbi:peptide-methionine (R)-S-oxide reductase MsrB [Siansivirga zeaxanthinifaciens]|uniref:peptide-methionine (R)-S-oxide reductase n=1 Tax=Siansivirga zeaxanthinifaciens CC-SAMT-1 TaxID=1454006 RepID=A0A0C5WBG3_9FLAO|nr:peptide-methionine (R)-S-oxide reductase MsrB [Siansivirga zeaxanthinifaciens]AJR04448.1 peptide methionine sulfoxide reductase [Siansivirga zeaxanthinifaciens CC-SAMT-1]
MKRILTLAITLTILSCNSHAQKEKKETFKVSKTDAEWKAQLSNLEYNVLRHAATEPPFSSKLNNNHQKGVYVCKGCDTPLFKSEHKFNSGTGWPSFDREIEGNVAFSTDYDLGYERTEEHCATCGGHLGHVFNDGPKQTTGERHCINGAALKFVPKNK